MFCSYHNVSAHSDSTVSNSWLSPATITLYLYVQSFLSLSLLVHLSKSNSWLSPATITLYLLHLIIILVHSLPVHCWSSQFWSFQLVRFRHLPNLNVESWNIEVGFLDSLQRMKLRITPSVKGRIHNTMVEVPRTNHQSPNTKHQTLTTEIWRPTSEGRTTPRVKALRGANHSEGWYSEA